MIFIAVAVNVHGQCPDQRWAATVTGKVYVDDLGIKAIYGNYTNLREGQHVNDGNLYFFGDIANDGYFGDGFGKEYIKGCNNEVTNISGNGGTEFNDLEVDNSAGVDIAHHVRIKSSLTFRNGILNTDRATESHRVTFYEGATYKRSSDTRHINGSVAKQGSGTFVFPVGDGEHLSPVKIKAEQAFDFYSAKYYSLNLGFIEWAQGGQFSIQNRDFNIQKVQGREYWKLKGAQSTRVTLYWSNYSEINEFTDNINNLVVVGWDGDKWVNLGKTEIFSFLGTGTVTSKPFVPNQYSAITFGVADTDGDGYADGADADPLDPCIPDATSIVCQERICVDVQASVYLEGAMHFGGIGSYSTTMNTRINDFGYLPGEKPRTLLGQATNARQPYFAEPWLHDGYEGENYGENGNGDKIPYDNDIVDWVLVSLRTSVGVASTVCKKAALIKSDGEIILTEYFDCCERTETEYYIVVEHRNHLPVMTPNPIPVVDGVLQYDFRSNQSYTRLLGSGQKEVLPGIYAMYAGNGDQTTGPESSKDINSNDFARWTADNGKHSGYYFQDYDLSGDVNVHDQALWLQNNGIFTDVER